MSSITGVVCSIHGDQAPLNYCPKCGPKPIERDELLRVATQIFVNIPKDYRMMVEQRIDVSICEAKYLIERVNQEFSE